MSAHATVLPTADKVQVPAGLWKQLPIIGAVLAVAGIGGTFAIGSADHSHLFAYLTAFMFWLSLSMGALFFVMIFSLTRSGWFVAVRRLAENVMMAIPVFALLFVPIVLNMGHIYHWMDPGLADHDPLAAWKAPYLNQGRFLAFAAGYFVIWIGLAFAFYRGSVSQDSSGDHRPSVRLRALAAPGIALAALSSTFAAFDWNMSIDFHWFSTMYGVIWFAGSFMAIHALLAVFAILLNRQNALGGAVTVEHYHGLGKMLFGVNCFWAYVSFSQFMLIWYANIPEETLWFEHRITGSWFEVSMLLLFGHFVVPFFFLMSHHIKRNTTTLMVGAIWLLAMHYVDMYWMIMPNIQHEGARFGAAELLSLLGVGGAFFAAVGFLMQRTPLVPVKDPRLPESMAFEN